MGTSVLDCDSHVVDIVFLGYLSIAILEGGVTQTIAEGITHGDIERVEVTVAHIDILFIVGIVNVTHITLLPLIQHIDAGILVDGEILR